MFILSNLKSILEFAALLIIWCQKHNLLYKYSLTLEYILYVFRHLIALMGEYWGAK